MSSTNFNSSGYICIPIIIIIFLIRRGKGGVEPPLHNTTLFYKENECQLPSHPCKGQNNKITKGMFGRL